MVLNTLVYIALVIIVIIVIVILLRFLFNVLFIMPVTLENDLVKYVASTYLPTWFLLIFGRPQSISDDIKIDNPW
jgi:branched-subunit amino acid transport protein AzlD